MKKILLATTLMAATAFTANAATKSFNGAYLGAQAGFVKSKVKAEVTGEKLANATNRGISTNVSRNSNGFLFGLYGGYGQNLNGFYVGGEMSILTDTAKRHVNSSGTDTSNDTYTASVKYKRGIVFGFAPRLGYIFGENLIYVKPGFEVSKDKATSDFTRNNAADPQSSASKTAFEFTPSVGYERAMGKFILRTEYTYNPGKTIAINDNSGTVTGAVKASYRDHRFVIGTAYKF